MEGLAIDVNGETFVSTDNNGIDGRFGMFYFARLQIRNSSPIREWSTFFRCNTLEGGSVMTMVFELYDDPNARGIVVNNDTAAVELCHRFDQA